METNVTRLNRWQEVEWQSVTESVQQLRQRIYVASEKGNLKTVSRLQKLMLRSRANWLLSIRRVTQINEGRRTPGVDQEIVTTPEQRLQLFYWLEDIKINDWNPPPVQRAEIPKTNGKKRPLGIPTIKDRVIQAIVKNALEPFWEARFETTSYGFRPGRSAHDAIVDIHRTLSGFGGKGGKMQWILDADIKGAFDNIDHDHLLQTIGNFPGRKVIKKWLEAGVMVGQRFRPSTSGTPQGGIISPLLANIALHGMEEVIGVKRQFRPSEPKKPRRISKVKVVKYADDFVVIAETKDSANDAWQKLADWLEERGLEMSVEKTSIVHIDQGFDFLGFTIKRLNSKGRQVIHTFPSKKSIAQFKDKMRDIFGPRTNYRPITAITTANPYIRGWANYFKIGTSKATFNSLDHYLWHRIWRYALRRHPQKSKNWIYHRYYKASPGQKWIFYDQATGINLIRMARLPIERHIMVKYKTSPDDPALAEYWAKRQVKSKYLPGEKRKLWRKQEGICPECGGWLDTGEQLEVHHTKGCGYEALKYKQLLHHTCHDRITQGFA